jgi:uncharacterized protein
LLLDINNVFVSSTNLGGHYWDIDDAGAPLLIDAHSAPVARPVWELYAWVIARIGPIATVIKWDNDIPDWSMLRAEAAAAERILVGASRASAA